MVKKESIDLRSTPLNRGSIMTLAIPITSDIPSKIKKMCNGNVFSNEHAFISELIQNSQRAKATRMDFTVSYDTVIITDNGHGCNDPASITTFDLSQWESTEEGFGMGIWSILAIPNLKTASFRSKNWILTVDINSLYTTPIATMATAEPIKGFQVTLHGEFDVFGMEFKIEQVGKHIEFPIYYNDIGIQQTPLLSTVISDFTIDIKNELFSGRIGIHKPHVNFNTVYVYYEKREVTCEYMAGITGVIELKPGAVNLREPDRTQITYDSKYRDFKLVLRSHIRDLYKSFLKTASQEEIANNVDGIGEFLHPEEYLKYLYYSIDNILTDSKILALPTPTQPTHISIPETVSHPFPDIPDIPETLNKHDSILFKEALKKNRYLFWADTTQLSSKEDKIALARYYGIAVYISPNKLYNKIFTNRNIPNIDDLHEFIEIENSIKNQELKTNKEHIYLTKTIKPITSLFKLDQNQIRIANLSTKVYFKYEGKRNRGKTIESDAITDGTLIYIDRKYLNLKRFNLQNESYGIHDLKALIATSPAIAHELAHLLYKTTDNTIEHYKYQSYIHEIICSQCIS